MSYEQETLKSIGAESMSDILDTPVPGFLFENCFREKSITMFTAPAHRGKTMLMLDIALCLDLELPLFGRFAPLKNRRVFFIGADAPRWDYRLQTQKLLIGHGIPPEERKLLDITGIWRRGTKITDPDLRRWLEDWRRSTGTDVLMIDSHRATHDSDENSNTEMKLVWDHICGMRDKGWTIIMSHHAGKQGEVLQADVHGGRGATVVGDSADFIYNLNKRTRADTRVQMTCAKGRGAAGEDEPFSYFEIVYIDSDERVNDRPIQGIKLLASGEDAVANLIKLLHTPTDRATLVKNIKVLCPDTFKNMTDKQMYRWTDNRLQELQRLGRAKTAERGIWQAT